MSLPAARSSAASATDLAVCLTCAMPLEGAPHCQQCGRAYPVREGILEAIGPLEGRNRIVAAFYDGPGWPRFRPWERLFLAIQGGARRARGEILRHLQSAGRPDALVLEVGINDGENLRFLPSTWNVHGADIARTQLQACALRHPALCDRLTLAEAEHLPFLDATFDACYTIGGFTYFGDHARALREMRRVTKPGGPVVVADEVPGLHRAGIGHLLGRPGTDAWWLRKLGLDREFVEMVLSFDVDVPAIFREVWPNSVRHAIWHRLGYCVVDTGSNIPSVQP